MKSGNKDAPSPTQCELQKTDTLQHHNHVRPYAFCERGRTKLSPTVVGREVDNATGLVVLVGRCEDSLNEGVSPSSPCLSKVIRLYSRDAFACARCAVGGAAYIQTALRPQRSSHPCNLRLLLCLSSAVPSGSGLYIPVAIIAALAIYWLIRAHG